MLPASLSGPAMQSKWDGLSEHLIASFYVVKKDERGDWVRDPDEPVIVRAPLTESSMEISLNWQSPFENAGAESKAPALMAMLQSGALQPFVDSVMGKKGTDAAAGSAQQKSNEFMAQFTGRTGITKLNSTQVFNGMPPVKFQITALFRAWSDPVAEVETPVDMLMKWALPVELSKDGSIIGRGVDTAKGDTDYVSALMPSRSPVHIAMNYKNRTYSPLVIESISPPINSHVNSNGRYVEMLVPMTICSLTAIDRADWANTRTSSL